jgi:hypothetical protein
VLWGPEMRAQGLFSFQVSTSACSAQAGRSEGRN